MREIDSSLITEAVEKLCIKANYYLPQSVEEAIERRKEEEPWPKAKEVLCTICQNIKVSAQGEYPLCQDTGMVSVWLYVGQDVHFTGAPIGDAINEGVRRGYKEGYLRASVVNDPLRRTNTGDNTPAVINYEIVPGDKVKIVLAPKGFGSENMSKIAMLKPAVGIEGVKRFILDSVKEAGANPCPPMVVGVGIGGTAEKATAMAKEALLRPIDERHRDDFYAQLEEELLSKINEMGIGPAGFGGETTALAVNIKTFPTHIAGLPVAVNICCHVCRHCEKII